MQDILSYTTQNHGWSLALSLGAALAAFQFKVGAIPLLLGCSVLGVLYYLAAGALPGGP